MNHEDIIRMAREAGLAVKPPSWGYTEQYHFAGFEQTFERFAALVAAKEREACAKMCEKDGLLWGQRYAAAIRERGVNDT